MVAKSKQISGVTVTTIKDAIWRKHLKRFKRGFLGTSRNAKASKILNEEVLNFDYDSLSGVFEAFAYEPLIIENKRLGYRLRYLLEDFKDYAKNGYFVFYGFTSFSEADTKRNRRREKYGRARNMAYLGSLPHFFETLYAGTIEEEGYEIYHAKDLDTGGRVIDINQLEVDSIVSQGNDAQTKKLQFDDLLYVYYKNEKPPAEYFGFRAGVTVTRRTNTATQESHLKMRDDENTVYFESNGYIVNPLSVYSFGIWAFEKVGDLMPINYELLPTRKTRRRKR